MGGAGPYVEFSLSYEAHYKNTGIPQASLEDLDIIWSRAAGFVEEHIAAPLIKSGWVEREEHLDTEVLFLRTLRRDSELTRSKPSLSTFQLRTERRNFTLLEPSNRARSLSIPSSVGDLLEKEHRTFWESNFRLDARRPNRDTYKMYIHTDLPSISNLVYLIQLVNPGLITLVREEEYDESAETIRRILPAVEWIESHQDHLKEVLGHDRFHAVVLAAGTSRNAFSEERWSTSVSYGNDSPLEDFTACDKECGYCGRCDY